MPEIKPRVEILAHTPDPLSLIYAAFRQCYHAGEVADMWPSLTCGNIPREKQAEFVAKIMESGHASPIEHVSFTFAISGVSRALTHQLVRHRIASYSQESTRYCNYTSDKFSNQISCIDIATGFHYDMNDPADRRKWEIWSSAMESAEKHYFEMIDAGAKPEEARSVLPNSLKTEIVMTMDLREWRHFIRLRGSRAAHPQIVEITAQIREEFIKRYPVFFEDLA